MRIKNVVETALKTGYLTIQAENQLRKLLATQYDFEDLNAFMSLQEAAMMGSVKQESRELFQGKSAEKTLVLVNFAEFIDKYSHL
ncbi:hypothetical protein WJM97_22650 [Okeanomitos corallinicola TIOX110]|uniref:Uncharacterized protein n=1 Tax=Okeanomitos corallinicola TIOX110 TaxID=3133117 RepID=A0ABZ2V3K4_9CYAN